MTKYDVKAPLSNDNAKYNKVRIKMSQHIGMPAVPVVNEGDSIVKGQLLATVPEEKLGSEIHSSINGKIINIVDGEITIGCID